MTKKIFTMLLLITVVSMCLFPAVLADETAAEEELRTCEAVKGTVKIDGEIDAEWSKANVIDTYNVVAETSDNPVTMKVRTLWDENYFYALFEVKDNLLSLKGEKSNQDSIEMFYDEMNVRGERWTNVPMGGQFRVNYDNSVVQGDNIVTATKVVDGGYVVEIGIPWYDKANAKVGHVLGVDFQVNNDGADTGTRTGRLVWNDKENRGFKYPNVFGLCTLVDAPATAPVSTSAPAPVNPKTGDDFNSLAAIAFALISGTAIVFIIKKKLVKS